MYSTTLASIRRALLSARLKRQLMKIAVTFHLLKHESLCRLTVLHLLTVANPRASAFPCNVHHPPSQHGPGLPCTLVMSGGRGIPCEYHAKNVLPPLMRSAVLKLCCGSGVAAFLSTAHTEGRHFGYPRRQLRKLFSSSYCFLFLV